MLWLLAVSPGALHDWSRLGPPGPLGSGSIALAGGACPRIWRSRGKFASLALRLGMSLNGCGLLLPGACGQQEVSAGSCLHSVMAHLQRRAVKHGCPGFGIFLPWRVLVGGALPLGDWLAAGALKQASTYQRSPDHSGQRFTAPGCLFVCLFYSAPSVLPLSPGRLL